MLGKRTQRSGGVTAAHRQSVATCQHTRLKPREWGDRLLCCLPTPGRVPRRSRVPLPVSPRSPQEEAPQRIQVNGQHRVARDQDTVSRPEEGHVAWGVARRVNALLIEWEHGPVEGDDR